MTYCMFLFVYLLSSVWAFKNSGIRFKILYIFGINRRNFAIIDLGNLSQAKLRMIRMPGLCIFAIFKWALSVRLARGQGFVFVFAPPRGYYCVRGAPIFSIGLSLKVSLF